MDNKIESIADDMDNVEIKFSELESAVPHYWKPNESLLGEVEDRWRRKFNVIVFGLREPLDENNAYNVNSDKKLVSDLIKSILPVSATVNLDNKKCSRLSKFSQALLTPRPVKIYYVDALNWYLILCHLPKIWKLRL